MFATSEISWIGLAGAAGSGAGIGHAILETDTRFATRVHIGGGMERRKSGTSCSCMCPYPPRAMRLKTVVIS
eukprot:1848661-Rhodomonas_salina.1